MIVLFGIDSKKNVKFNKDINFQPFFYHLLILKRHERAKHNFAMGYTRGVNYSKKITYTFQKNQKIAKKNQKSQKKSKKSRTHFLK